MFRKNNQERTQSAVTRVASTKKLPSDFFTPSKKTPKGSPQARASSVLKSSKSIELKQSKDSLLFTFNQSDCLNKTAFF